MILMTATPEVVNIISTLGFPIAACVAMGYYVKYIIDKNREDLRKTWDTHEEEIDKLQEAINNNTLAIQKLLVYLGGKE